jgi:glycosyltransferase involved in cell wall biosynthesis
MSYHANVSMALYFYNHIMPLVWQAQPQARLVIVGKDPTPEIVSLGDHPNVEVTGTVQDMRPYLHRAMVAVAPITYGAGIQNKVLEAMACGTAVVASRQAVSAIQAVPDHDLLVADHPEEFAHKILNLLGDAALRQQLQHNGHLYLEQNHRWSGVAKRLEGFYLQTISA